ncbi:hypothetical protein C1H46_023943 [Malus baccata]|uniref:Uncharacterized protein n=1 Tax=Malus baccata TaxID=106549 RepID=A0A540LVH3_MALBA|nr:hypothetical protein C1H46_023943 [Malus baccata]
MSTNLINFRPILTAPCAAGHRRPSSVGGKGSPSKWWTPIFGWSSEPDYFDPEAKTESDDKDEGGAADSKQRRSRFAPGCFTEEKARQLRIKTIEMETYHDAMYHSSIANRLASDFRNRSDL